MLCLQYFASDWILHLLKMYNSLQNTSTDLNNDSKSKKTWGCTLSQSTNISVKTGLTNVTAVKLFCSSGRGIMSCQGKVPLDESISRFLLCCQEFQLRGFVAMQSLPSETGMTSVLEKASSQGLGVETLYPELNQTSEGQVKMPCLQSQSWMRHVCVSWTVSADSVHY